MPHILAVNDFIWVQYAAKMCVQRGALKCRINGQVQVSSCVNNLKHMALDMNNEITTQNAQMDRLNSKVQSNKDRISDANKRAITLLK